MSLIEHARTAKEKFDARNGNDAIRCDGWVLFSNGAMREATPYGVMMEPPKDPYELAKNKFAYHEEVARRAIEEFREAKRQLENSAYAASVQGYPPPGEAAMDKLRELQAVAQARQATLEAAREELTQNTPPERRERQARRLAAQQQYEAFLSEIKSIRI